MTGCLYLKKPLPGMGRATINGSEDDWKPNFLPPKGKSLIA